jgi:alpha-1,2-mannosyltransferase
MFLYAYSLRTAAFLMVNSSWTKNHVDSILTHQDTLLSILFAPLILLSYLFRRNPPPHDAKIAYPSCDTREMSTFKLEGREKVILSVAQFR